MMGRRSAALLCVLLAHALVIYLLLRLGVVAPAAQSAAEFASEPITISLPPLESEEPESRPATSVPLVSRSPQQSQAPPVTTGAAPAAITPDSRVDWPVEGKKAAARVLAREAETERIARLFAGPKGTWASLTKRQRSKLDKFRFRPGIDGLEYDAQGNQILHISDGCVIVNSMFFACALGKPMVHDDMFDNMRLYFDEQRLPQTNEGNGTEPEALRPAN